VKKPLPENDPRQRQPNIERARKDLGWEPRTQLDEGLRKTIGYFEKLLTDEGLRATLTRGNGQSG